MNIRTTLMLMAATVAAPLTAQQPADVYTALAAPATASATADQRAAAMPALAIMPADTEVCYAFTDIPGFIENLRNIGAISESDIRYMPEELLAINSFALAGGKGSSATIKSLMSLYNAYSAADMLPALKMVAAGAAADYAESLKAAIEKDEATTTANFKAELAQVKLAPCYGVLALNADKEDMATEWYETVIDELQSETEHEDGIEFVTINGFKGIKAQMPESEAEATPWDDEMDVAIKQEVCKHIFYVLLKQEGTNLIAVVCEDPTQINTAATPQDSILGTDKLAKGDSKLSAGLNMVFYASAEATAAMYGSNTDSFAQVGKTVQSMFTTVAAKADANQAKFAAAAKGMGDIIAAWDNWVNANIDRPTTAFISWGNKCIDVDFTCDNCGFIFKPAKLSLLNKAADPNTILYGESAYLSSNKLPQISQMIDAGISVADGVMALAPADQQNATAVTMAQIKAFLPEAKQACDAFSTVLSGLDNTCAVVLDASATMPFILGGKPGNTTAFPRLAIYSGVSDRAKLSAGWDSLLDVAGKVAEKVGYNAAAVNMLPIAPKVAGKATSYSVSLPWFSEDMVPNLTVSDTAFVAGTSAVLNAEIAETATATADFNGAVFTVKFAPLATALRSVADDMADRAEAEAASKPAEEKAEAKVTPATPPAPVVVVEDDDEEDFDDETDYVEEDDFDEEDVYSYHYVEKSPAQRRADSYNEAAEAAEAISEYVDSVNGVYAGDENDVRIHVQVKFKK